MLLFPKQSEMIFTMLNKTLQIKWLIRFLEASYNYLYLHHSNEIF